MLREQLKFMANESRPNCPASVQPISRVSNAPEAIGPYSPAVRAGNMLFISGQIPLDPESGKLIEGDIKTLTGRILESLRAILESQGLTFANVAKTTIFLTDLSYFGAVNEVYAQFLEGHKPARSTIGVQSLPLGVPVEIEMIALIPS